MSTLDICTNRGISSSHVMLMNKLSHQEAEGDGCGIITRFPAVFVTTKTGRVF